MGEARRDTMLFFFVATHIDELMERGPVGAVIRRHVDDVGLAVHVLSPLRQEPRPALQKTKRLSNLTEPGYAGK